MKNYKKICVGIIIYLLIGMLLYIKGDTFIYSVNSGEESVAVTGEGIAQKIIGNDYAMREIKFWVDSCDLKKDTLVDVFLCEGSNDLKETKILQKDTLTVEDISEKGQVTLDYSSHITTMGRDYFIIFKLCKSNVGKLALKINTQEDSGVYNDDTDYGFSCAYEVVYYSHNTIYLFIWKLILLFTTFSAVLMVYRQKSFWRSLEINTLLLAMLMYILGLINAIRYINIILDIVLGIVLFGFVMALWKKEPILEKKFDESLKNDMGDIVCWLALLLLFLLHDKGLQAEHWDEYSHWATVVKNMYLFDKMPIHSQSTVTLFRYPPIYSLFQYSFLKLYGKYSVEIIYFAKHFFEASLILGVVDVIHLKKRKWTFYSAVVIVVLGLPDLLVRGELLEDYNFYNTLYVDITLGVMFGVFLIELWKYNNEDNSRTQGFLIFISAFILIMLKDNGMILFASAITGIVLVFGLGKKLNKKWLYSIFWGTGGFLLARISWDSFVKVKISQMQSASMVQATHLVQNVNANQSSTLATTGLFPQRLIDYVIGNGAEYQYAIIPKHILHLLFGGRFETKIINFSFVIWILIFLAVLGIIKCNKSNVYFVSVSAFICAFIYHVVYTFTMSEREAVVFASEERYLGSFLLGIFIWIIYLSGKKVEEDYERKRLAALICTIIILVLTDFCGGYRERVIDKSYESERVEKKIEKAKQIRMRLRETDKLFYISCKDNKEGFLTCKYYLTPIHMNSVNEYAPRKESAEEYEYIVTDDELKEKLNRYDYLYLDKIDEQFYLDFGTLFEDKNDVEANQLYRIDKKADGLSLFPVKNFS